MKNSKIHCVMKRLKRLHQQKSTHRKEVIFTAAEFPRGDRQNYTADCRVVGQVGKVIM